MLLGSKCLKSFKQVLEQIFSGLFPVVILIVLN